MFLPKDEEKEAREREVRAALREVFRDRMSADALRNPVLADLVARCERCGDSSVVEIGCRGEKWFIRSSRIARDEQAVWRHTGCAGRMRFYGRLPEWVPERIVSDRRHR